MGQKQHVDFHRKVSLRNQLISYAAPGCAYLPFCGDGDLGQLYYRRPAISRIYAADLNPERVDNFRRRCPKIVAVAGDCDRWPFPEVPDDRFSVGDFDAYAHPYPSFLSWFETVKLANRLVLFFTDGHRQGIIRSGVLINPDSKHIKIEKVNDRRRLFHFYAKLVIEPWFKKVIKGWKCNAAKFYLRAGMIYWGAVISRSE